MVDEGIYFLVISGYPPSSYPLKVLLGAGSAKSIRKIIRAKDLGVKI
jgi:hypothetical protein